MEELRVKLEVTRNFLEQSKVELMDYVSGGRDRDDIGKQKDEMDRLRWERDYWAYRVQSLQWDIGLMEGFKNG
jgi:hypothetical protein